MRTRRRYLLAVVVTMFTVVERDASAQRPAPTAFTPPARASLGMSFGDVDSLSAVGAVAPILSHSREPMCRHSQTNRVITMTLSFGFAGWVTYGLTRRVLGTPPDAGLRNSFILIGAGTGAVFALLRIDCLLPSPGGRRPS